MNDKSILMPHTCQKIGWWLLLLIPLMGGFYAILYFLFRETHLFALVNANSRFITMLSILVVSVSMFLICLSKEEVEDEMISLYRLKAVGISAFVCFIVVLVSWTLSALDHGFHFAEPRFYLVTSFVRALLPFLAAGLYYILFKTMLRHANK